MYSKKKCRNIKKTDFKDILDVHQVTVNSYRNHRRLCCLINPEIEGSMTL